MDLDWIANIQAVYWQFDHSLRIYPLPHALVLADAAPAADCVESKSGCVCINPVSSPYPASLFTVVAIFV